MVAGTDRLSAVPTVNGLQGQAETVTQSMQ